MKRIGNLFKSLLLSRIEFFSLQLGHCGCAILQLCFDGLGLVFAHVHRQSVEQFIGARFAPSLRPCRSVVQLRFRFVLRQLDQLANIPKTSTCASATYSLKCTPPPLVGGNDSAHRINANLLRVFLRRAVQIIWVITRPP